MIIERPFDEAEPPAVLWEIADRIHDFSRFAVTEECCIRLRVFEAGRRLALVVNRIAGPFHLLLHVADLAETAVRHVPELRGRWSRVRFLILADGYGSDDPTDASETTVLEVVSRRDPTRGYLGLNRPSHVQHAGVPKTLHFALLGDHPAASIDMVLGEPLFSEGA